MEKQKARNIDFGSGNMASIIIRQALPLTASQLAGLIYNIVDRIFIGHIPEVGSNALSGLGLTLPIVALINAFTLLMGQGGSPIFSMARGAGKNEKASRVLGNSFLMLLVTAIVLTLTGYLFMKPVIYFFGGSDNTYIYAFDYLKIYLAGTIFQMLATGLTFYITAQGHPGIAMLTTMTGAAINLILDPIFIFALGMGIRGAAAATLVSQTVSFIWVMIFIRSSKAEIRLEKKYMKPDPHTIKQILSMGFTGFVMEFTNSLTQVVCNKTLKIYGGDLYVGIMTIVNSVRSIMGLVIGGITSGAQPVLGFNYGAHKFDRVKKGIRITGWFSFIYTAFAWLVVFLFPGFFINMFSDNPELNTIAVKYLHIFFMAYIFMALQYSGQSTFMALGKAKRSITFSLFRKVVLVVPLTIILPYFFTDKVSGIFWAEPISNIIGGTASFVTMYLTLYRKLGKERY